MTTIYEVMQHNFTHRIKERGTATLLHPLRNQGEDEPYAYALQYHATDVVISYPDGSVRLDSGGYSTPHYSWSDRTKTVSPYTRERINRYLPSACQIYQKNWKWYLVTASGEQEFVDGVILTPEQMVINQGDTGMQVSYDYAI